MKQRRHSVRLQDYHFQIMQNGISSFMGRLIVSDILSDLAWVKFPSTIYVHHIISASFEKKFPFEQWPIVCSKSHLQMARFLPKLLKIAECSLQWRDSPEFRCVVCPIGIFLNYTFYQSIIEIWIWFTQVCLLHIIGAERFLWTIPDISSVARLGGVNFEILTSSLHLQGLIHPDTFRQTK